VPKNALIYKNIGETPLEALERFRREQVVLAQQKGDQKLVTLWETVPMTYAGRLDPMAEGELLILIGEECKNKQKYLGLDKEYEVEILFGVTSDTYDTLGLVNQSPLSQEISEKSPSDFPTMNLSKHIGSFSQPYPPYSSKTVNGRQLHTLARTDYLPDEMPTKNIEIYSIDLLETSTLDAETLKSRVIKNIGQVKGDFRQQESIGSWNKIQGTFTVMRICVNCSSGTYMRSLAHRIGQDAGGGAIALSIKRTKIVQ
jgi:tRNA pseudouridine55 synthase